MMAEVVPHGVGIFDDDRTIGDSRSFFLEVVNAEAQLRALPKDNK
jgi:hypothetical protein